MKTETNPSTSDTRPEPHPAHPSKVAPHLVVNGAVRALDFYQRAFGASVLYSHPPDESGRILHASLDIEGGLVMVCDDFPEHSGGVARAPRPDAASPVTIHVSVANVDATMERAQKAGATVTMPAADMFWGDRYGKLRDPFGHEWSVSSPLTRRA